MDEITNGAEKKSKVGFKWCKGCGKYDLDLEHGYCKRYLTEYTEAMVECIRKAIIRKMEVDSGRHI